jgi:hypothetical protein
MSEGKRSYSRLVKDEPQASMELIREAILIEQRVALLRSVRHPACE